MNLFGVGKKNTRRESVTTSLLMSYVLNIYVHIYANIITSFLYNE